MHEMLKDIDAALKAVGADKVRAVANPDVHDALMTEDDVTIEGRTMLYRNVNVQRSTVEIPDPGYTVQARFA